MLARLREDFSIIRAAAALDIRKERGMTRSPASILSAQVGVMLHDRNLIVPKLAADRFSSAELVGEMVGEMVAHKEQWNDALLLSPAASELQKDDEGVELRDLAPREKRRWMNCDPCFARPCGSVKT
jgi:hypothetical protein